RETAATDAAVSAARDANLTGPISHAGGSGASWIELVLDLGWKMCRLFYEPDSSGEIAARVEREADILVDATTWPAIHQRLAAAKAWDHKWLFDGLVLERQRACGGDGGGRTERTKRWTVEEAELRVRPLIALNPTWKGPQIKEALGPDGPSLTVI